MLLLPTRVSLSFWRKRRHRLDISTIPIDVPRNIMRRTQVVPSAGAIGGTTENSSGYMIPRYDLDYEQNLRPLP